MNLVPKNTRLTRRAYWLIRLRWIAICGVLLIAGLAYLLSVDFNYIGVISVSFLLMFHNTLSLYLLNRTIKSAEKKHILKNIKNQIFQQIIIDIILLSVLLNFSGGIENPFYLFFLFHIIISSILLSRLRSYFVFILAFILFLSIALLEYYQILPHNCLCVEGFYGNDNYLSIPFILSRISIFSITAFIVVYLTGSIAIKLRFHEDKLSEAYKRITKSHDELKRKDAVKDEYVLRVTHDIKGHLAAIQTNLAVLVKGIAGQLDDKQLKFTTIAYNRTLKLSDFVQDLLKVTKMRLSNDVEYEKISMKKSIIKVIDVNKDNALAKNISLSYTYFSDKELIFGNQFSIEELISNLVLNAIKYTPNGGKVEVLVKDDSKNIIVTTKDTGVGIPKEDVDKVFEEFFRASNVKTTIKDGTGLGLSLVKQIVNRHNGNIWVESELNKGTSFIFALPIAT